jgi:hypothetical protein
MLEASQSNQAPSMPWGGSPTAGAPPTWLPLPPVGFWPPTGFRHSSPTDRSGVLAVADAVGSSTWRASIAALWIASMEDTASTYNFHASHGKTCLCQNKFHMFTWLLHIANRFIYMSFRAAQDHNKAAGRDMTSSMPSWTRREDPVATTWYRSFSFICIWNCLELSNNCLELSNLLFCFLLPWTWMSCCRVCILVYSAYFGGSSSGEATKIGSSKKTPIFIGKLTNIGDYICRLADEYKGPCVKSVPWPHALVYSSVTCHRWT